MTPQLAMKYPSVLGVRETGEPLPRGAMAGAEAEAAGHEFFGPGDELGQIGGGGENGAVGGVPSAASWQSTQHTLTETPFGGRQAHLPNDHFEFKTGIGHLPSIPDGDAGSDVSAPWVNFLAAVAGDGRPDDGGGTPQEDSDPDPAPPPVTPDNPPEETLDPGRSPGATPGDPADTPASPPPGTDNVTNGRAPDATPDMPPDGGVIDSYTSGGTAGTSYNVTIEFAGTWTTELQAAFIEAAEYLSAIILSDLPDAIVDGVSVDDISITATLDAIDGVGGVLGSAGPRTIRGDGTYLPSTGAMTFDIADAQDMLSDRLWETVVLHEMLHALGFGTLWSLMGLTSGSIGGGDLRFIGANATDTYNTEFPGIAGSDPGAFLGVPVETDGGSGTAGGHWDETLFDEEIMTGYVDAASYVSVMSIAALEDMGYDTVYDSPYSATDLSGPIPPDPLLDLIA